MYLPVECLRRGSANLAGQVPREHSGLIRFLLTWRLCQHKRMNLGKPNEDKISIQSLLKTMSPFPSYEELGMGKQVSWRVKERLNRTLDYMEHVHWRYDTEDEEELTGWKFYQHSLQILWESDPYEGTLLAVRKAKRCGKRL